MVLSGDIKNDMDDQKKQPENNGANQLASLPGQSSDKKIPDHPDNASSTSAPDAEAEQTLQDQKEDD